MRAIAGIWRWRHNPLRRATDLAEAWIALLALALIVVAAPVAGAVTGALTNDALLRSVAAQHEARHSVTATVLRGIAQPPLDPDPETSSSRDAHRRVLASWTAPDGSGQAGTVVSDLKSPHPGDRFRIWTDDEGRVVARPLDTATATTHAALAGLGAALACAGLIEGARRLALWRLVRRRHARWDQAWDSAGPDWGRAGTGA
ncbi:Rv1733c family protein [Streptomyces lasiicapitis]|uniref:Rv1733c family protein n=1 Tax=Streptomyces lasiicapitis TaxID=1923961 RepID=UPI003649CADD